MKKAFIFFLVSLQVLCFAGCKDSKPIETPANDGEIINQTDNNAPKSIESIVITDFYADYFVNNSTAPERSGSYSCRVTTDDQGVHTLQLEGYPEKYETVVDDNLLVAIQDIIDRNKLIEMNGYSKVTSGLPPENQPCHMHVVYDSGETLTFKEDNDPDGSWNTELYNLLESYLDIQ